MRSRLFISVMFLLTFKLCCIAQDTAKQRLIHLFEESEACYMMDDYQQLLVNIEEYKEVCQSCYLELGDSIDVFNALKYKLYGSYMYGLVGKEDSAAYYAEQFYQMSLAFFNRRHDTTHALKLHEELAQLYYKVKDYEKAKSHLEIVYDYYEEFMPDDINGTLSQLAMCNARLGNFSEAVSQIEDVIKSMKSKKSADYFEALRKRGKILMLWADKGGTTTYERAVSSYRQYVTERYTSIMDELIGMTEAQREQHWLATHQFLYDCYRLGNLAPEMLYNLALYSKGFLLAYEKDRSAKQTDWSQVRKRLNKYDCAIEFIQYFGRDDEKRLGCLVLRNNSKKPLFIDLFSTDSLLSLPLTTIHTVGSAIESPLLSIKDTLYRDTRLVQQIWSPCLLNAIGDAKKIYFSPDGLLHQWAIEYIMPDTSKVCYRLSSTRILTQKRHISLLSKALLCGGIDYGADYHSDLKNNDVNAYRFLSTRTSYVNQLPGSVVEIDSIRACRLQADDTILRGEDATDEAFIEQMRHKYDIVHISTHGYCGGRIGIFNDIKPLLGDNIMSESGLLFAGCSRTLTDHSFDEDYYDGVLSAMELSTMDFSQTEMVVLSACQTGNGRITDDGIYGIQRGLKQAGAQSIIVSLWPVNDKSCSMLMIYFYQELAKQEVKDIHSAFMKARTRLMDEKDRVITLDPMTLTLKEKTIYYDYPRYVNPFILIDIY